MRPVNSAQPEFYLVPFIFGPLQAASANSSLSPTQEFGSFSQFGGMQNAPDNKLLFMECLIYSC